MRLNVYRSLFAASWQNGLKFPYAKAHMGFKKLSHWLHFCQASADPCWRVPSRLSCLHCLHFPEESQIWLSLVGFGLGHTTQFLGPTFLICKFVETVVFLAVLFSKIVYAKQGHWKASQTSTCWVVLFGTFFPACSKPAQISLLSEFLNLPIAPSPAVWLSVPAEYANRLCAPGFV